MTKGERTPTSKSKKQDKNEQIFKSASIREIKIKNNSMRL